MTCARLARLSLRGLLLAALPGLLAGCVFGTETDLREEIKDTLFLRDTLYFSDRIGCTAAVFSLYARYPKPAVLRAGSVPEAIPLLKRNRVVAIEAQLSPDEISDEIIERQFRQGISLLNSGLAGADQCLEPELEWPLYEAMLSPDVVTVFDPVGRILMLLEWDEKRVWVLRSGY